MTRATTTFTSLLLVAWVCGWPMFAHAQAVPTSSYGAAGASSMVATGGVYSRHKSANTSPSIGRLDWPGGLLLVGTVVGVVGGAILTTDGAIRVYGGTGADSSALDRLREHAISPREYQTLHDDARDKKTLGWVEVTGGVALVAGGALCLWLFIDRLYSQDGSGDTDDLQGVQLSSAHDVGWSAVPMPGGGMVTAVFTF